MNINPDDPKWTAYVLGELSDRERAQVEKELETSAAAREAVEEIRLTTDLLRLEMSKEPAIELSAAQKRALAGAEAPRRLRTMFQWSVAAASLAAAVLIVATLGMPSLLRSRQAGTAQPVAALESPKSSTAPSEEIARVKPAPSVGGREKPETAPQSAALIDIAKDSASPGQAKEKPYVFSFDIQGQQGQQGQQAQVNQLRQVLPGILKSQDIRLGFNSFAEKKTLAGSFPAVAPAAPPDRVDRPNFNTEAYDYIADNPFIRVEQDPRATFSIDVDTASYANMRRFLTMGQLPPKDSVRIEEMINYFTYDYASPSGRHPIATYTEVAAAPWNPDHRLVRIGIKAREIDVAKRPPSNLVFLIDVSGSMATPEKLPMLQNAMKLMVERLGEGDHVAIVTYAGATGLRLPSTSGERKEVINAAIDGLNSAGSTNGSAGIVLAYETAISNFIRGGTNRVILATDGDFNVGVTNQGDLIRIIEEKAKSGVFLSVLGFGMGNYKDSTLEKLADKGNGNYAYIDTLNEARKVLVEEMSGTLLTVAKDVKVQVEFNPAEVNAYRLIGYENRTLRHEDFNDDKKDAGDMGAGHTVTALFEVVPHGVEIEIPGVDALKYQQPARPSGRASNGELLNVRIRYKEPEGNTSQLIETPVVDRAMALNNASNDFRFAAAVASFGMILRDSPYKGQSTMEAVLGLGEKSKGTEKAGYREEFLQLVRKARTLKDAR